MSEQPPGISKIETIHFIEDIALFFERLGMPRMAGKILGVLLIADPPAQSITDISEQLNASKSSVSIMARLLVEQGLIERAPSPIPRRDYYIFKDRGWILYMRQWLDLMRELHQITERGLRLVSDKPAALQERLLEAHDLFSMLEDRLPLLLEHMEQERGKRAGAGRLR